MKQSDSNSERSRERTRQIKKDIEQLRRKPPRLKQLNAREKALSDLIRQRCFPPESNSTTPPAINRERLRIFLELMGRRGLVEAEDG
jgi:hypothetical protein